MKCCCAEQKKASITTPDEAIYYSFPADRTTAVMAVADAETEGVTSNLTIEFGRHSSYWNRWCTWTLHEGE